MVLKDALKENHSPELQFLSNNDTDDYIMVVVLINEEFATIRREEQQKLNLAKEIKRVMRENPFVNAEELASN